MVIKIIWCLVPAIIKYFVFFSFWFYSQKNTKLYLSLVLNKNLRAAPISPSLEVPHTPHAMSSCCSLLGAYPHHSPEFHFTNHLLPPNAKVRSWFVSLLWDSISQLLVFLSWSLRNSLFQWKQAVKKEGCFRRQVRHEEAVSGAAAVGSGLW